jgi:hypothetical protein
MMASLSRPEKQQHHHTCVADLCSLIFLEPPAVFLQMTPRPAAIADSCSFVGVHAVLPAHISTETDPVFMLQIDTSSVPIAIGEPLGGGMFVSNVVLALVVLASANGEVHVERAAFLRDTGFYAAALVFLVGIAWDGVVRPPSTLA